MTTPIRQQYLNIKKQYPDVIVFFRLGDFYETFDDDARLVAGELDVVLTSRPVAKGERIPMAGVPHHAAENYLARLIAKGYKVAIAEQTGTDPQDGLMPREVVRVVTPGTVVEASMLDARRNNYLAAVAIGERCALAFCDITTGEFAATQFAGSDARGALVRELERLAPAEVLVSGGPDAWHAPADLAVFGATVTPYPAWRFDADTARRALLDHFKVGTLDGFGIAGSPPMTAAAGAIVQYLKDTQAAALAQLTDLRAYSTDSYMLLDAATRRNLELTRSMRGDARGALLSVLDQTLTPMGARLLHTWINQPLLDRAQIESRLDAVAHFAGAAMRRAELRQALKGMTDLERLVNRVIQGAALPREMNALRAGLERVETIRALLADAASPVSVPPVGVAAAREAAAAIAAAISDEPPATMNNTGVIRGGYSAELDGVSQAVREAKQWLANLERTERERTGIKTLKVGYNQVFGYYIEISKAASEHAPSDYIRKQTLTNAERYITPALKEQETLILNAEERTLDLERQIYRETLRQIAVRSRDLLAAAHALAHLDVCLSLAEVAVLNRYVRPVLSDGRELLIAGGRHPVVELSARQEPFVPNDTRLSDGELVVLTGPNMAGKTTYLRQTALIVLMAQIGSFVPADEAHIGIVDRIFTRVGAQDDISAGQSTFMVEMVETANILHHATPRSLLILDEIGRGTSTYDGLAIAWAVIEHIHNHPRLQAKTLFATHYHELIALSDRLPRVKNYNVAVSEAEGKVTFLRKIVPGGADRSYGIHVAQLAGLPRPIINRAEEIMDDLESQSSEPRSVRGERSPAPLQPALFNLSDPVLEELKSLDLEALTPLEALNRLYQWQSALKK
ncbi:MAG: DNA mismatch repair protein MutS [Chloroflexi bacterium]|nr:DNA mismatch repair protein MutS [Chloroflexota bacterium]